jgi:GNAT superfamily N-acetyltransferase
LTRGLPQGAGGAEGDGLVMARACEADIPALSALLSMLFAQEAEFSPDPAAQCKGLASIIAHPELGAVLLVREGAEVLAMVSLLFTVSTALGERVAMLEDMVVSSKARGAGVGARLLGHALSFARDQGCKRITLLTDRDNLAAQRFYAKQGFAASTMVPMRLFLP